MATVSYVTIEGQFQGPITDGCNTAESMGNKYQQDHADESTVLALEHNITIPTDPQSGQPTGQRVHMPMVLRKRFDKATPLLAVAVTSGENLQVTITFWRTSMEGAQEHYFTVALEDARLVDIRYGKEHTADPAKGFYDDEEVLSFSYRKITWTHEAAGTSGADDWRAPRI
jgi:type VI secretion system secreted protein Hcp